MNFHWQGTVLREASLGRCAVGNLIFYLATGRGIPPLYRNWKAGKAKKKQHTRKILYSCRGDLGSRAGFAGYAASVSRHNRNPAHGLLTLKALKLFFGPLPQFLPGLPVQAGLGQYPSTPNWRINNTTLHIISIGCRGPDEAICTTTR